jgi:L-ascorbate metabolism protein UlaG (beta-lactamase superfamily)
MKLTYYGHACFGVEVSRKNLLFDPFIRPNELAKHININSVPADYIFITHGHSDHIADAVEIAQRTGAMVVSNYEIVQWLGKAGLQKLHPLNHGGSVKLEFGRAKFVPAFHSSSLPDGAYGGNPAGFVIESAEGNFYYSGDTSLMTEMKLIGEGTRLNFAVLPIGDNFTMGADDAVRSADMLGCSKVVGVHFDTFPPIRIDHAAAIKKFETARKQLVLLKIGESVNV